MECEKRSIFAPPPSESYSLEALWTVWSPDLELPSVFWSVALHRGQHKGRSRSVGDTQFLNITYQIFTVMPKADQGTSFPIYDTVLHIFLGFGSM